MMKFSLLVIALGTAVACTSIEGSSASAEAQNNAAAPQNATEPNFVEQGIDELSSPFTRETVLKLNAIVARSKDSIDTFDKIVPDIRKAVAAQADGSGEAGTAAIAQLSELRQKAQQEVADMKAAEAVVRSSGEKYNDVILSAMVGFVVGVEDEIGDEIADLNKQLKPN